MKKQLLRWMRPFLGSRPFMDRISWILAYVIAATYAFHAFAQTITPPSSQVSLVTIINTVVMAVIGVVVPAFAAWLRSHMNDKAAADTLADAIQNAAGAVQQAVQKSVTTINPRINVPGVTPEFAAGIQYVLDHAGDEAARFGITQAGILSKINAQVGLLNIKHNAAITSSPSPDNPSPLAPVK